VREDGIAMGKKRTAMVVNGNKGSAGVNRMTVDQLGDYLKQRWNTELLDVEAAAGFLGLGVTTLNKWRTSGAGPAFIKMGARVAYTRSDLERFIAQKRQKSTAMTQRRADRVPACRI
jgi:predicted DNA-binding transcriptional regulator AlpA